MEPDPLIAPSSGTNKQKTNNKLSFTSSSLSSSSSPSSTSSSSLLTSFMGCNNLKKTTSGLNVVVCVLCLVCVTACVYNAFREAILDERLTYLEDRVASIEDKTMKNLDVIIERFRREAENRFKQRVTREVASEHHLIMGLKRAPRDAPECICPAGKQTFLYNFFFSFIYHQL